MYGGVTQNCSVYDSIRNAFMGGLDLLWEGGGSFSTLKKNFAH